MCGLRHGSRVEKDARFFKAAHSLASIHGDCKVASHPLALAVILA